MIVQCIARCGSNVAVSNNGGFGQIHTLKVALRCATCCQTIKSQLLAIIPESNQLINVFVPSHGNTMLQWDNKIIHVCFMCTSSIDITTVVITLLDTKCSTQTRRLIDPIL